MRVVLLPPFSSCTVRKTVVLLHWIRFAVLLVSVWHFTFFLCQRNDHFHHCRCWGKGLGCGESVPGGKRV